MNVNLMMRIADQIEQDPLHFKMRPWIDECGTTACIGGWAAILSGVNVSQSLCIKLEAINALDIDLEQATNLFYYFNADQNKHLTPTALRWMAATGEVDWYQAMEFARCVFESSLRENLST